MAAVESSRDPGRPEAGATAPTGPGLREYLSALEARGELVRVREPIAAHHELGAALSLTEAGPAVWFERVRGSDMPAVGNVVPTRERLAQALGTDTAGIADALDRAIATPVPTVVDAAPPARAELSGLDALPVPTFFSHETGPYVTAGVIAVRDAVTGERNLSFARLKVLGPRTAMLGVSPRHHLGRMIRRAGEAGRHLPFAVAVGTHPAVMLAACLYLGFGDDELECAGALLGRPVATIRAGASGIAVPSDTEILIEAVADADRRVEEGPVSEYHGHYHDYGPGYLVDVTNVTARADAVLQVITPGLHSEHLLLGGVAIAAGLRRRLRQLDPGVVDVAVPQYAAGRVAAVVSVRDPRPGQAVRLMMAAMAEVPLIKEVTVVDAPIDPWNDAAVAWARTFRVRADRDVHIFPPARSDRSDPLARAGAIAKLGIDATAEGSDREIGWGLAVPDAAATAAAERILAAADVPRRRSALVRGALAAAPPPRLVSPPRPVSPEGAVT